MGRKKTPEDKLAEQILIIPDNSVVIFKTTNPILLLERTSKSNSKLGMLLELHRITALIVDEECGIDMFDEDQLAMMNLYRKPVSKTKITSFN